jgi:hypothetical protein
MGSRQIAVKAFFLDDAAMVSNVVILDQWIPDEDSYNQVADPFLQLGSLAPKGGQLLGCILQENGPQERAPQGSVVTNCQKRFNGFLLGAHFLDNKEAVTNFLLLQEVSVLGYNETKCKGKFVTGLY